MRVGSCRRPVVPDALLTECVHGDTQVRQASGPTCAAADDLGPDAEAGLDVLELTEFAWHDCFGEVTPPYAVIDDVFTVARGSLAEFVRAARLAVEDYRDLRLTADSFRG
jgi:hypothetical protein